MTYASPFDRFVAPARNRSALWRVAVGILLMLLVYVVIAGVVFAAVAFGLRYAEIDWLMSREGLSQPLPVLLVLYSFLGMAVAPMVAVRLLHRRGARTLFGRGAQVARDFAAAAAIVALVAVLPTLAWLIFGPTERNLDFRPWLALLPLTVAGIALQTLAEELVFRGYFLQQMGARFRSPIAWMVLPSLLFGSLHFDPNMSPVVALTTLGVITVFGLAAADLTARTGSIGAAWGFHFANNLSAIAFLSVDGSLTGLSLFRTGYSLHDAGLSPLPFLADAAVIGIGWWLCRRVLAR